MAFGSEQWMYASGGFYPYEIGESLRFNSLDSAYLSWTPSVAGNRTTWTWSGWIKRCRLAANQNIFSIVDVNTQERFLFNSTDKLSFVSNAGFDSRVTDAPLRDGSSWYHIALVADTTNTTAQDRVRVYVNGVRQSMSGPEITSGKQLDFNNAIEHRMCMFNSGTADYYFADQYLAEINFVDGQALDPTSFGEFKSGVWIPKEYEGTYGTNGFYLDFGDSGSLGADVSGNGNNWTPTNLATTDQMLDSPTNNFATLNPLQTTGGVSLSEGSLVTATEGSAFGAVTTTFGASTGKWYFESCYTSGVDSYPQVGLTNDNPSDGELLGSADIGALLFQFDGQIFTNNGSGYVLDQTTTGTSLGDILGVAFDLDNRECSFFVNNTQVGTTVDISYMSSDVLIRFGFAYYSADLLANFGQDSSFAGQKTRQGNTDANGIGDFYYAPPAGHLALCSANLPDPAIDPNRDDIPADYFNPVIYQGDNSMSRSISGVGFQPDFTWIKSRTDVLVHGLTDSVRGGAKTLYSSLDIAELTNEVDGYQSSFDTDGFTLTGGTSSNATFNRSTDSYISWNWKAGGTAVANTDGDITSQVSANTKAGFSIVTFTAVDGSSDVGHGLDKEPEILIHKGRSIANGWYTFTKLLDGTVDYARLDTTAAFLDSDSMTFNSTTFKDWYSSGDFVAYCFHSVEGFSKFGTYTGNGSTDGPFVYTGFRPAYVMVKRTDTPENWHIQDSARSSYNWQSATVYANLSNAEYNGSGFEQDYLSNGFKFRTANGGFNASGGTYIYMAFAEMPFKYANAR